MKRLSKNKKRSFLFSKPVIIIEIILIVLLLRGVWGVYSKYERAKQTKDNIQIEFGKINDRYLKLESRVEYLGTDFAQEEAMRERFNVGKEGEEVIRIVNKEVSVEEDIVVKDKSFWRRIIGVFGL
jgi:cell division protein FtsB